LQENDNIDYKNVSLLQKFLNDRGRLVSRRLSGISAKAQRQMTSAVKRARYLALLPSGSVKH
jgi:small subunit ribosomal protein S18